MFDPNKHLLAAEYLIGTFYPTEDSPPAECLTTRQPLWQRLTPYWRLVVCSGKYLWRCPAAAELWTLDSGAIMLNAKTTEETHLRALVRGRSAPGGGTHYEGAIWDPDRYGYACRPGGGLSA